eukprot:TRINITY_DN59741_c0_g1_i1.p1 TRINITY_DN59741_c0_g1~~TRINITY_DN59741_c0_g1_i1.p1  ORF type:complete len:128 (+),score=1.39 TRINITY_DN59741_c0_g1_i1:62-445(+)
MSFIVVRHGADQKSLFNANCSNVVLLSHIKRQCGIDQSLTIDLVSNNIGEKNLAPLFLPSKLQTYTKDDVALRATYILLLVEEDEYGVKNYTPVLQESEDAKKLKAQLDQKSNDERKKAGAGKTKKK